MLLPPTTAQSVARLMVTSITFNCSKYSRRRRTRGAVATRLLKWSGARRRYFIGNPDPEHVSTSFVERQNLSVRMVCRRFTCLTNAFSKKLTNPKASVALHYAHYNFVRIHRTLR